MGDERRVTPQPPAPVRVLYAGGHPQIPLTSAPSVIWTDRRGVHVRVKKSVVTIPWDAVKGVEFKMWSELRTEQNGVTVGLLFGNGQMGYAALSALIANPAGRAADPWEPKDPPNQTLILLGILAGLIAVLWILGKAL